MRCAPASTMPARAAGCASRASRWRSRRNQAVRRHLAGEPWASPGGALPWEMRKTGSAAIECAFVAAGLLRVARFGRPHIWDVAGGMALVRAAGGEVRTKAPQGWRASSGSKRRAARCANGAGRSSSVSRRRWSYCAAGTVEAVVGDTGGARPSEELSGPGAAAATGIRGARSTRDARGNRRAPGPVRAS